MNFQDWFPLGLDGLISLLFKELSRAFSNTSVQKEYSLEGVMLKLKLQFFGYLMQRANSLEKTLMLGKIEGTRRKGQQRMKWLDSITDSMDMNLSKIQVIKPVNPKGNQP